MLLQTLLNVGEMPDDGGQGGGEAAAPTDITLLILDPEWRPSPVASQPARQSLARLRNVVVISGSFCFYKVNASTFAGEIGAIHTQIITKPVTSPSKLSRSQTATRERVVEAVAVTGHFAPTLSLCPVACVCMTAFLQPT